MTPTRILESVALLGAAVVLPAAVKGLGLVCACGVFAGSVVLGEQLRSHLLRAALRRWRR
jgi:hypothetical protein